MRQAPAWVSSELRQIFAVIDEREVRGARLAQEGECPRPGARVGAGGNLCSGRLGHFSEREWPGVGEETGMLHAMTPSEAGGL